MIPGNGLEWAGYIRQFAVADKTEKVLFQENMGAAALRTLADLNPRALVSSFLLL